MIPGIIKLGYVDAYILPDFSMPNLDFDTILEPEWIELSDVATLSEESRYPPFSETLAELSFSTPEEVPVDRPIAFIAIDALKITHIVGNHPPHCGVLKKTSKIEAPDKDASINYYSFKIPLKSQEL